MSDWSKILRTDTGNDFIQRDVSFMFLKIDTMCCTNAVKSFDIIGLWIEFEEKVEDASGM